MTLPWNDCNGRLTVKKWTPNVCVGKAYYRWSPNPTFDHQFTWYWRLCACMLPVYINFDDFKQTFFWLETSTGDKKRYVAIRETANHFVRSMLKSIPAFHATTGCDSVSSFSGIGMKTALTTLKSNLDDLMGILQFSSSRSLDLQEACVEGAIRFVCLLHDNKSKDGNINDLRYTLFSKKSLSAEKLQPILDALTLHLRRVAYQCVIWKNAGESVIAISNQNVTFWEEFQIIY